MSTPIRFTGATFKLVVFLERQLVPGGPFLPVDLSGVSSLEAALVDRDDSNVQTLIALTAQSDSGEANWKDGKVEVKFSSAQTSDVTTYGKRFVEIQFTSGGELEIWDRIPVEIRKGTA